jgi:hypothetical protein
MGDQRDRVRHLAERRRVDHDQVVVLVRAPEQLDHLVGLEQLGSAVALVARRLHPGRQHVRDFMAVGTRRQLHGLVERDLPAQDVNEARSS